VFLIPLVLLTACSGSEPSSSNEIDCDRENANHPECVSDRKHEANSDKHEANSNKHEAHSNKHEADSDKHGVDSHKHEADNDKSEMFTWDYSKLTHAPVDFSELMADTSRCSNYLPIQPYFNHFIVNHTEGPKKWYLATCSDEPLKVFMPAKVVVQKRGGINVSGPPAADAANTTRPVYDGHEVIYDTQLWARASENVMVFFMHLTLLESIHSSLMNSEEEFIVIEAGTHIGYIKNHPSYEMEHQVIDFGVEDNQFDAGLTASESWWNQRVNPFDYFTDEIKESLKASYQPVYRELIEQGTHPFTDLEDSRANLNSDGEIWGTWFKADSSGAFRSAAAWSVIHATKTQDLSAETYWKTLEEHPDLSGILLESKRSPLVGKGLYEGRPAGRNRIFIESGNSTIGIAKVIPYYSDPFSTDSATAYWKYSVDAKSASTTDDTVVIEVFADLQAAHESEFSDRAVKFQREPR